MSVQVMVIQEQLAHAESLLAGSEETLCDELNDAMRLQHLQGVHVASIVNKILPINVVAGSTAGTPVLGGGVAAGSRSQDNDQGDGAGAAVEEAEVAEEAEKRQSVYEELEDGYEEGEQKMQPYVEGLEEWYGGLKNTPAEEEECEVDEEEERMRGGDGEEGGEAKAKAMLRQLERYANCHEQTVAIATFVLALLCCCCMLRRCCCGKPKEGKGVTGAQKLQERPRIATKRGAKFASLSTSDESGSPTSTPEVEMTRLDKGARKGGRKTKTRPARSESGMGLLLNDEEEDEGFDSLGSRGFRGLDSPLSKNKEGKGKDAGKDMSIDMFSPNSGMLAPKPSVTTKQKSSSSGGGGGDGSSGGGADPFAAFGESPLSLDGFVAFDAPPQPPQQPQQPNHGGFAAFDAPPQQPKPNQGGFAAFGMQPPPPAGGAASAKSEDDFFV
jgi:hypothetical protein